ncbi:MAG: hypothetical protein FVQ84_01965 [Planctomycetes bacterium]|nr:hypothetical protein [Planctomycetota bacterium]
MSRKDIRYEQFPDNLTEEEKKAIRMWLGVYHEDIRLYQLCGVCPNGMSKAEIGSLETRFSSALSKAVLCAEIVFRGLWATNLRTERIKHIRSWIEGCKETTIHSHDSATISEEIGRSWAEGPDCENPNLSVLLRIKSRTARYIEPFQHAHCNEFEVVMLKGSSYRRTRATKVKSANEFWEIDLEEIA